MVDLAVALDEYLTVADELLTVTYVGLIQTLAAGRRAVRFGALDVDGVELFLVTVVVGLVGNDFNTLVTYVESAVARASGLTES